MRLALFTALALALAAISRNPVATRPESRPAPARRSCANVERHDRLWRAICAVESGNNPKAVGDGGKAVGVAQIWVVLVNDANRILRRREFTASDRLSPTRSRQMFDVWAGHYYPTASDEIIARRWNQGVGGRLNKASAKYWEKVVAAME